MGEGGGGGGGVEGRVRGRGGKSGGNGGGVMGGEWQAAFILSKATHSCSSRACSTILSHSPSSLRYRKFMIVFSPFLPWYSSVASSRVREDVVQPTQLNCPAPRLCVPLRSVLRVREGESRTITDVFI